MRRIRFLQLDVFTERAGGGNPLGVVIGADAWDGARMQAFAGWTGLVETTFLLAPTTDQADYRLRIFTPTREIPFAGHPSIGSAHAAVTMGVAAPRDGRLVQECGAGLLALRLQRVDDALRIAVQSPPAHCVRVASDVDAMWREVLYALPRGQTPAALMEGGRRWWLAELDSEATLRAYQAPHAQIAQAARADQALGLALFARGSDGLVVRAFPCAIGIDEDPASGAANALIAAWLRECEPHGALARGYRVSQGREIGRDATLDIAYDHDGAAWVGGRSHVVIEGTLDWPLQ
jgi:PhzF family phenazine biosynthesis protein